VNTYDQSAELVPHLAVLPVDHLLHLLYVSITFNPVERADDMKKYGDSSRVSGRESNR